MHFNIIVETTNIQFVIIFLGISVKIWVTTFKCHTIHTVHINHLDVFSDLLITWKYYPFVLQRLELLDESPVELVYGIWRLLNQRFVLSLSQVSLQKSQAM